MYKDEKNIHEGGKEVEDDGVLWATLLFFFSACC
jgi:hypothetical protein